MLNGSQQISAPLVVNGDTTFEISSSAPDALSSLGDWPSKTITKAGDGALIINARQKSCAGAALLVAPRHRQFSTQTRTVGSPAGSELRASIL